MQNIRDKDGKLVASIDAADPEISGCEGGVWMELFTKDGANPLLCFVKDAPGGPTGGAWYLGVYSDKTNPGNGCDFAISFTGDGPMLQARKGKDVRVISLFDLLGLVEKPLAEYREHCEKDKEECEGGGNGCHPDDKTEAPAPQG